MKDLLDLASRYPDIHYYAKALHGRDWARLMGLEPSRVPSRDASGLSAFVAEGFADDFVEANHRFASQFMRDFNRSLKTRPGSDKTEKASRPWFKSESIVNIAKYLPLPFFIAYFSTNPPFLLGLAAIAIYLLSAELLSLTPRLLQEMRRATVKAALERGWNPKVPAAALPPGWETILAQPSETLADRGHDLTAALTDAKKRSLGDADVLRVLADLRGEAWGPFVRASHLGYAWNLLKFENPKVAEEAVATLVSANPHELALYLEEHPADAESMTVLRERAPDLAAALDRELSDIAPAN